MPGFDYPLLLTPRFDPKIWGGRRLETVLGKSLPDQERYGESLESDDRSRIVNGPLAGKTIGDLIARDAASLLGRRGTAASGDFGDFPLLAKFIDASDTLSVQVHPDDDQARPLGKRGKTEAWRVIAADPGARLITGVSPEASVEDIEQAISDGRLEDLVIEEPISAGDTLLVPAGTTHAIGAGILLYEIQQSSDVTYRMYDWGRFDDAGQPRELHVAASLAVVKPELRARRTTPLDVASGRTILAACSYFALEQWNLQQADPGVSLDGGSFRLVSAINGSAGISTGGELVVLSSGQTALLPARAGSFSIEGDASLLVSYIPDLESDVIAPLRAAGYSAEEIAGLAGALDDLRTS